MGSSTRRPSRQRGISVGSAHRRSIAPALLPLRRAGTGEYPAVRQLHRHRQPPELAGRVHPPLPDAGRAKAPQWWLVRTTGGYVPVVRERHGDRALFRHVDRCLDAGGAIAIFPEGNYGQKEGELLPFHKGFAHFAIKAGVPVIPVALSGTKDLWFRKRIEVVIGRPMPSVGQDPAALTELAFERMKEMLPAYSEPPGRKLLRHKLTHLF
ncbi:MAG: hypothetical protein E6I82_07920 [Chloroflexi bacterium]|nr:MAG: hypothetical protein E6I82_07920 [Chloroflexota bacterium]